MDKSKMRLVSNLSQKYIAFLQWIEVGVIEP